MSDVVLATVMFTDIVGSSERASRVGDARWRELLERHNEAVREQLARFGGDELDNAGDGFFASFQAPGQAVRCAAAIVGRVQSLGLAVRIGIHTGECERVDGKLGGVAVHIGARVCGLAGPSEVLVSGTVRDLLAGAGLAFADRGLQALRGIPGDWRLYRLEPPRVADGMPARIQFCGRTVIELDGRRVEDDLPGRQGRVLFAYLAVNRHRSVGR
ncbi:MAG: adenylate/guanylate cyclase domain-containing protein, partial [Solirubrobacteraceae bacterium]